MNRRSKEPTEPIELIDDRAIASAEEDRLRHAGFSEELAELVGNVPAPANVALFGSWGAGKSELGKLLCKQLDGTDGIRCVIYDAFKYDIDVTGEVGNVGAGSSHSPVFRRCMPCYR